MSGLPRRAKEPLRLEYAAEHGVLSSVFRNHVALRVEILALRHQIGVLQRSARKRPKLSAADRQAIETAVIVTLPMLVAGLLAGVIVSVFQTVTSIQDNVLAFIPRAAAIFVVFALTFPWMLRVVSGFSSTLIHRLPDLVR
jgi:flagellar biosynthetic protein FliQ